MCSTTQLSLLPASKCGIRDNQRSSLTYFIPLAKVPLYNSTKKVFFFFFFLKKCLCKFRAVDSLQA